MVIEEILLSERLSFLKCSCFICGELQCRKIQKTLDIEIVYLLIKESLKALLYLKHPFSDHDKARKLHTPRYTPCIIASPRINQFLPLILSSRQIIRKMRLENLHDIWVGVSFHFLHSIAQFSCLKNVNEIAILYGTFLGNGHF